MKGNMQLYAFLAFAIILMGAIQAYAAEAVTVKGELIDTYCYGTMGAKGPSHRSCAIECVKKGIPAGLLEDGTNKVYVLLPAKDNSGLPPAVIEKMGERVTITGKAYSQGGSQFLTIESIK
jgi:hypothetical protein